MRISDWSSDVCSSDLVGDDYRLWHLRDDADGVDLLGVDIEDLLPGGDLLLARLGELPLVVELEQLLGLRHVDRLAGVAVGLGVLAPHRPLQAHLADRHELLRAAEGRRDAVLGRSAEHTSELQALMSTSYA